MEYLCERCRATRVVGNADIKIIKRTLGAFYTDSKLYLIAWAQCRGCGSKLYWNSKEYREEHWWD